MKNKKLFPGIVNTDLLAFSLDWWMGSIFIVCFNAFTDSRPGCSAHFSLTDLGILPSVWISQRNKQQKWGVAAPKVELFPLFLLYLRALNCSTDQFTANVVFYRAHVAA